MTVITVAVFESDGNARERRSRSFLYNWKNNVPAVFFYIMIYVFVCMISWMVRPTCEITDQLARKTAFRLSFNFYTPYTNIKTSAQNAPKCTIAGQKK